MGGVCGIGSIKGRLSPDDIDGLIDDVFGTGVNPDPDEPTYSPDDIATEKELNNAITDVFG